MAVRRIQSLAERFWPKVDRSGGPDVCWPWTGARSKKTSAHYGVIRKGGKLLGAHRVSLALVKSGGRMPKGKDACHKCDNPICCNPDHLFWGTHRENMRDYAAKYGRIAVEKRPPAPRPILQFLESSERMDHALEGF